MVADSPENPWVEIIGLCYTGAGIRRILGMTQSDLSTAVSERRVLALTVDDGAELYPAFQLRDGEVVRGLREVLTALATGIDDPWTWATWLNVTTRDELEQEQPRNIDRLAAGDVEAVVLEAERDAWHWST